MKRVKFSVIPVLILAVALVGCSHEDHQHAEHGDAEGGHGHSHGGDAQSFSGATHKEGTGITLLDETRKLLGIQTTEVQEQALPREVRFTARVFSASVADGNRSSASQSALGTVSTRDATFLQAGLAAQLLTTFGEAVTGLVDRVSKLLPDGDTEIVATFHFTTATLKPGDFVKVIVSVPSEKSVRVVPRDAVIKSTSGNLVYAVNGDAYTLTWIELGAEANGLIEVTDGLLVGDSVVTHGAMELWLVELRAVKGGQGCCPAPPKKGKS